MAKSGRQYGDEVRTLRAAGFDFPASRGYTLRNPAQWSPGLKSAVTRAFNTLAEEPIPEADAGLDEDIIEQFFDDGAGDAFEEWGDIDYFDFQEADDLDDEESDSYDEEPN